MDRRGFLRASVGALTGFGLAACSGGDREARSPEPGVERPDAVTTTQPDLGIAVSPAPEYGPGQPLPTSTGLAAERFGTANGDRYFDAAEAGDEAEVRRRMQVAKRYGPLTRVDFNGYNHDWKMHDLIMGVAKEEGLGVVAMIGYIEMSKMPAYSEAVMRRYGFQRNGPIVLAELGNEPNGTNDFGKWGNPDPEAYAAMAVQSARAIHALHPDIPIITGGLSPGVDSAGPRLMAPVTYLRRALDAMGRDGRARFVGWGYHPYAWDVGGYDKPWSSWNQIAGGPNTGDGQSQTIADVLDEFGAAPVLYLTEFGAPTGGNDTTPVTLEGQAADANMFLHEAIPGIETPVRLWHTVFDNRERTKEGFFGLVTLDGREKPAGVLIRETLRDAA